jgi:hypothetical protein
VRILFLARHYSHFRNYDSVLRELAGRGHHVHLAVETHERLGGRQAVAALARECPLITCGDVPARPEDQWTDLVRRLRQGLDYVRYLDSFYADTPFLRARARERTPRALITLAELPLPKPFWPRLVGRLLDRLDLAAPPPAVVTDYLREQRPDVLLVTPLIALGSQQIDFVRAARRLQIPTALAVWSWDHLSSKGFIRECPERVMVWNETQRQEAVALHGVPRERVVVTGAQCFDRWFDRRPSRTRDELCLQIGLPADRPLVLYVCTGLILGSPPEAPFVREWLTRLRASHDPRLAAASVLVRPHPSKTAQWEAVDLGDLGPVAIWGGNPIDEQSRADYFDSLFHADAVVGMNTSAFIEAGIVGREVLAILPPAFYDNHEGTSHFRYLLEVGGGLLRVARDFETHERQLSAALSHPRAVDHPHRAFLEQFVRPRGIDVPATPVFVDAVERLRDVAVERAGAAGSPWWSDRLLRALARRLPDPRFERWMSSPRELAKAARIRKAAAAKDDRRAAALRQRDGLRTARAAQKARALDDKRARVAAERQRARSPELPTP